MASAKTKYNFVPESQKEMLKILRYCGSSGARIDTPMLHPDHMKIAAILFRQLAADLELLAGAKGTNISKIFSARAAFNNVQERLTECAAYDISYLRNSPK
jgi:ABC-type ATPase with predicted acetyltransferase domain